MTCVPVTQQLEKKQNINSRSTVISVVYWLTAVLWYFMVIKYISQMTVLAQVVRIVSVVADHLNCPAFQDCCLSSLLGAAVYLYSVLSCNVMYVYTSLMSHSVTWMSHLCAMNDELVLEGALHVALPRKGLQLKGYIEDMVLCHALLPFVEKLFFFYLA